MGLLTGHGMGAKETHVVFGMSKVIAERVRVSVCVCISPVDLLQPLPSSVAKKHFRVFGLVV